ncbi:permease prefix domain 1-containing protein [Kribbella capetownensis]|uniref:permease prefix domain 1-containing protein n=1 Tax=Kribbella capetownensis TaxID=1572659 RepID=UPI001EDFE561|nr:permease prefix domain 1-containing protein [Kribbella capetownensis]
MSSTSTPVDAYLTALGKALPGPRRRKADLLAEARDHLVDATEAFEADGLDRDEAEREAVADFGELSDVVPGYRADLAVSQSRRTAMMLFLALIIQPIVWQEGVWSWNQDPATPNPVNDFLQSFVRTVGMFAIAGAVLAVIAAGIGLRNAFVRQHVTRVTAVFALVNAVVISLIGVAMSATGGRTPDLPAFGVVGTFVVLPLVFVGLQAGRCLRLARA